MTSSLQSPFIPKRRFYRTLFHKNRALLRAILSFNQAFYEEETNTRLEGFEINENLRSYIKSSKTVCHRLTGTQGFGFWDFEEESRRILLVDRDLFKKGIEYWGASFCAPAIRGIVSKSGRSILERKVGSQLVGYAMGRGDFYLGQARDLIPVEGFNSVETAGNQVCLSGIKALAMVSLAWPQDLRKVALKMMPKGFEQIALEDMKPLEEVNPGQQRLLWGMLKNIFLREVAPEWSPCFS